MDQVGQALHRRRSAGRSCCVTGLSLGGLCFDVTLITEILTPYFLAINFCGLFLDLIYCTDQVLVEWD